MTAKKQSEAATWLNIVWKVRTNRSVTTEVLEALKSIS